MGVLDGKVILVLGTGAGLGKEVVRAILREGGTAAMADLKVDVAEQVRTELDPEGAHTSLHEFNLADLEAAPALVEAAVTEHGRLDGIAAVAALDNTMGRLLEADAIGDWEKTQRINVAGNLAVVKAAAEHLGKQEYPAVVFVGSVAGAEPSDNFPQLAYGLSKYTMVGMTHHLSRELGPLGIRVNNVAPGYKWGPVLEGAYKQVAEQHGITPEEAMQPQKDALSLKRFADDADVANAIVFYLCDWSKNITGQVTYVDAGQIFH